MRRAVDFHADELVQAVEGIRDHVMDHTKITMRTTQMSLPANRTKINSRDIAAKDDPNRGWCQFVLSIAISCAQLTAMGCTSYKLSITANHQNVERNSNFQPIRISKTNLSQDPNRPGKTRGLSVIMQERGEVPSFGSSLQIAARERYGNLFADNSAALPIDVRVLVSDSTDYLDRALLFGSAIFGGASGGIVPLIVTAKTRYDVYVDLEYSANKPLPCQSFEMKEVAALSIWLPTALLILPGDADYKHRSYIWDTNSYGGNATRDAAIVETAIQSIADSIVKAVDLAGPQLAEAVQAKRESADAALARNKTAEANMTTAMERSKEARTAEDSVAILDKAIKDSEDAPNISEARGLRDKYRLDIEQQKEAKKKEDHDRSVTALSNAVQQARASVSIADAIAIFEAFVAKDSDPQIRLEAEAILQSYRAAYAREQEVKGNMKLDGKWLTPEQVKQHNKTIREKEYQAKAEKLVMSKHRSSVHFKVIQSLNVGALCTLLTERNELAVQGAEVFLVLDLNRTTTADGEVFVKPLYWAGTHTYTTRENLEKTVNSYTSDKNEAIRIVRGKFSLYASADNPSTNSDQSSPRDEAMAFAQVSSFGSGFIITTNGYLVSNYHVISNAKKVKVRTESELVEAKVIAVDVQNDLALLKIEGAFQPVMLSPARSAKLGQTVFAIGFPMPTLQGFSPKVTKGIISSLTGVHDDVRMYQVDVAVQPGNSGGPLADEAGNILGVVVARLNDVTVLEAEGTFAQNVNYAVKKSYIDAILDPHDELVASLPTPPAKAVIPFEEAVDRVKRATVLVVVY